MDSKPRDICGLITEASTSSLALSAPTPFSLGHLLWGAQELMLSNCVVLEETLESPLDCKEIQSVCPKGDQSWIFIGRTDAEAEAPIFWSPDVKRQVIGKAPDAGKDCGRGAGL